MKFTPGRKIFQFCLSLCLAVAPSLAADPSVVEIEKLTWVEIKDALAKGKTTVLIFNGGTEQRGPHTTAGGHNLIANYTASEIAKRLGNALVAPVIPYSINRADPELPGTIGLSSGVFASLNEEVTEQLIKNGFKAVVLMGDHGGGQKELETIATKLDAKYKEQGVRVLYCSDVYAKANNEYFAWLDANGYPKSSHGGIPDTSEMLYIGGNSGWVRKELIPTAVGEPVRPRGEARPAGEKRVRNGISGDARRSTPELGKRFLDLKVDLAVKQIQAELAK